MRHLKAFATGLGALMMTAVLPGTVAQAATITPTVFTDDNTDNGNCTLREAILAANGDVPEDQCPAGSGPDAVQLLAGTYTLSVGPAGDGAGLTGDLDVSNDDLTIRGAGASVTAIDGGGLDRVLQVGEAGPAITIHVEALTITGGNVTGDGGGIRLESGDTMFLADVAITANMATGSGGAIENNGVMRLDRSVLTGNESASDSGAIENFGGDLTIVATTFTGNRTSSTGGAIENYDDLHIEDSWFTGNVSESGSAGAIRMLSGSSTTIIRTAFTGNRAEGSSGGALEGDGTITIENSTFSGNHAQTRGGAIRSTGSASVTVSSSTVAFNDAVLDSGAFFEGGGTYTLSNTIVGKNSAPTAPNCDEFGSYASNGHNVVGDGSCGATQPTDKPNTDPLLGPLGDNGGPTPTHALLAGSPAIDAGAGCPATDQRGAPRSGACDIGAYELVLCRDAVVNRVGTAGDDLLTGTDAADGFLALQGNDTLSGLRGADRGCGGEGNDKVSGGPGNDRLSGEAGKDTLRGGSGKDRLDGGSQKDKCIGGPKRDRARRCEVERSIP